MNYKCTFLNTINGVDIDIDSVLLHDKLQLLIGTNTKTITDFYDLATKHITGIGEYENSLNVKCFIHNSFSVPKDQLKESEILNYLMWTCTIFSNALWMIKDSSVRFNIGHLKYTDGVILTVHSNFIDSIYSNSIGQKDVINFSKQEIESALTYFDFFFKVTTQTDEKKIISTHAEANRIERAYYFIDSARKSFDIGMKTSLYCSAFECLFSVSATELRHRLSETIANFLGTNKETKKVLYEELKNIYDLRSSVTHGSGISKKLINNNGQKLNGLGKTCDEIMRKCFVKIINDNELTKLYIENNNDKLSAYLTDLIFQ